MRVPLLALLVLAAGCVAPLEGAPGEDAGIGGPAATTSLPWELRECRYFIADVSVPAERLQPLLPEGFTVAAAPGPLAPVTGGGPYLGIEAFSCASGTGLANETVAPIAWASFYTPVEGPAELMPADHLVFVMWDTLVPDAARRDLLAARGLPVRAGEVAFEDGPGGVTTLTFSLDGLGAFTLRGGPTTAGSPFAGDFVEYMEGDDGALAAWRTHYEAETLASGPVVVESPAGSWIAEVVGGERVQGRHITGTWSFTNGTISW